MKLQRSMNSVLASKLLANARQLVCGCTVLAMCSAWSSAALITQWNFNSVVPDAATGTGTLIAATGAGTASLVGGTTATFASGDASGGSSDPAVGDDSAWNLSTWPAQGAGDKTAGAQFASGTAGFQDIKVTWDQRHSNTTSRYVQFQYSTDGTNFVDFGSAFEADQGGDRWYNGRMIDLSTVNGVNNNANFAFRVVNTFAPSSSGYLPATATSTYGTGTQRFDMVTIEGNAVPEPATVSLGIIGLLALVRTQRARRA
ncbi:MAG: PEP-CTERM sorting domain-containing protein [Planctomycetota bacterium]|nr:PEP-CTERM sorting domain-containing protein [Planctomycetota bacterium]MDA1178739.1 PEP-CTERM sorting domain-containing protein [Planctomycetota bacterium]